MVEAAVGGDGHGQALLMLQRMLGCTVEVAHDSTGAPFLPTHPGLWVSISHCRSAVAVAVGTAAVGIDVECRPAINPSLAGRVCSEAELREIEASPDRTMAFLRLWTWKEAVLKLRRTGIQGFGSLITALADSAVQLQDLECPAPHTVASLAVIK
ncbi:MAG: 4'-phosphopantetheinyl transferase superfamily protein [Bacteroidales bacterium]|nr:4'-phosphopantetheinyl transferase superfamily protein [Bacteroidales bacterium]